MPSYDALHYDPPAPIAQVSLRAATISDVLLLLDTGAETTLLPRDAITRLGITPDPSLAYDLIGFDGTRSAAQAVDLDMIFLQKAFRGRYLIIDSDRGILGRDVMASVALLFNGPAQEWSQQTPWPRVGWALPTYFLFRARPRQARDEVAPTIGSSKV